MSEREWGGEMREKMRGGECKEEKEEKEREEREGRKGVDPHPHSETRESSHQRIQAIVVSSLSLLLFTHLHRLNPLPTFVSFRPTNPVCLLLCLLPVGSPWIIQNKKKKLPVGEIARPSSLVL